MWSLLPVPVFMDLLLLRFVRRESSDESGTDGEEEDEESRKRKAAMVPNWARGPQLKEALERQYGMHGEVSCQVMLQSPVCLLS